LLQATDKQKRDASPDERDIPAEQRGETQMQRPQEVETNEQGPRELN